MYVGVDIGGTKTLVAVLNDDGVITEQHKFPTPVDYHEFLAAMRLVLRGFTHKEYRAGGIGMPVTVFDRDHERAINFSNLPWRNVHVQHDLERLTGCPMATDNDAKLAALSEAMLLRNKYDKVLYVTVSTGIGFALVNDGVIDDNVGDGGGRLMLMEHKGKRVSWESFASGHAIVERWGKRAVDITDEHTWHTIARDLAQGIIELIALTEPQIIVLGGSVGTYFYRYGDMLTRELKKYKMPLLEIPPVMGAQRPEQAVIYGCYDFAKQVYPHAAIHH